MRELHGYHGEHRRHVRDAAATTDTHGRHARDHARDAPDHTSRDAPKFRVLDPEAQKAEHLKYRQKVEAAEAEYAARHAKPSPGDQPQRPGQFKPREPKPEHAPPEARDKPASEIAGRRKSPEWQREERHTLERSRLPKADTVQMLAGNGLAVATIAVGLNLVPDSWEKVAASVAAAVIGNVAWGNRRWKDKHGNRPED